MSSEGEAARKGVWGMSQAISRVDNPHFCYILYNDRDNRTYVGYTVDPARRLRQHNGEIKGGARATSRLLSTGAKWKHLCVLSCADAAFDHHKALSLEWHLKHPDGHRKTPSKFHGPRGRLAGVAEVLKHEKFAGLNISVDVCAAFRLS